MKVNFHWFSVFILGLFLLSGNAWAQQQPVDIVRQAITNIQQATHGKSAQFKENPQQLNQLLTQELVPIADFPYIAASVMGKYYQAATPIQRQQFAVIFEKSALETITQGLLSFNYDAIKVNSVQQAQRYPDIASVEVSVTGTDNKQYPVSFTLRLRNDQWKVINVIANGINLGLTFRNQFDQAMQNNQRNFDQVIQAWDTSKTVDQIKQSSHND